MHPRSGITELPNGRFQAGVFILPGPNPFATEEFETREEAEAWCRAFPAAMATRQRVWREQCQRKAAERRREFVERVRARHETARKHLQRTRADVTRIDGFLYRRSEFRSLRDGPRRPRPALRMPSAGRASVRRRRAPARADPSDDEPSDLDQLGGSAESQAELERLGRPVPEPHASELHAIGEESRT
jgi:hypothetical protein